jgi:hypothetical protein
MSAGCSFEPSDLHSMVEKEQPDLIGLSSAEVVARRAEFGPNTTVVQEANSLKRSAAHFWPPVPWMLEATIIV